MSDLANLSLSSIAIGDVLAGNASFEAQVREVYEAKEVSVRGPVKMAVLLEQILTEDQIGNLPVPGSRKGETGNKPYDIYNELDDSGNKVRGAFYSDIVARLHIGRDVRENLEAIENKTGKYAMMGDQTLKAEKAMWQSRFSTAVSAIRRAARIHQMFDSLEQFEKLEFDIVTETSEDGTPELTRTLKPFSMQSIGDGKTYSCLTVSEFLSIDPEYVAKNGGTIKAVRESIANARKRDTGDKDKAKKDASKAGDVKVITNLPGLQNYMNEVAAFISEPKHYAAIVNSLLTPAGDEVLFALGNLYYQLEAIYTKDEAVDKRYNKLLGAELQRRAKSDAA